MDHDVIIVGAGLAGCSAALEAARLGLDALLIDRVAPPGDGTYRRAMIPTAILRETLLCLRAAQQLEPGAMAPLPHPQETLAGLSRAVEEAWLRHRSQLAHELCAAGVHVEVGVASFQSPHELSLGGGRSSRARCVVLATGSRPRRPRLFPFDHRVICDSDSILQRTDALRSVVIVGADIVGCEFACLLASLGVTVTLVERRRKLVRSADREILEVLHAGMQRLGVAIALEEQVEEIHVERSCHEPHASIRLSSGRTEKCDRLLVLAGREGRMDDLRLDQAGLTLDAGGHIAVDEYGRTAQPGVYAVGDLAGPPSRAGVALYQGRVAVQHAAGLRPPPPLDLPIALNTIPEISFVGLGEEACRRLEIPCVAGFARFQETLMGLLQPGHEGLLKLVFRREDRCLLGVQIAGKSASELVHLGLALLPAASTADQLANSIFNQPSLSEAYRLAALDALHRL